MRGSGDFNNNNNHAKKENNIYEQYHRQLDNFAEKCKPVIDQQEQIANRMAHGRAGPVPAPRISYAHKPVIKGPISNEFLRRKEEFERNKARGHNHYPLLAKPPMARRDEKSIYEEKLRKIRLQNYNNKRLLNLDQEQKGQMKKNPLIEPDNRIKRMEALKVRKKLI